METDQATVGRFRDLLHCPEDVARFCLDASGGSFDDAIAMYYEQVAGGAHRQQGNGGLTPSPILFRLVNTAMKLPFLVLALALRSAMLVLRSGSLAIGTALPRPLVQAVSARSTALVAGLRGGPVSTPTAAAARFAREFATQYGSRVSWQESGWHDAASAATSAGRFLFVYLHAVGHEDTDRFARGTLCDPSVTSYIAQHFVAWGGDLRAREAFALAASVGAARFPFTALLAFSGSRTQLVASTEGYCSPDELLATLQTALDRSAHILWRERAVSRERDFNRRLREEQDAEFRSSLEADRQRQAKADAEAAKKAVEEGREREAAAAARRAEEAAAAEAAAEVAALQARRAAKLAALAEPPEASAASTAVVRIRLPDGGTHQRRFWEADRLQAVYDFVDSLEAEAVPLRYTLATTFPRRVFKTEELGQTLHSLGLTPQATLLLQPLL